MNEFEVGDKVLVKRTIHFFNQEDDLEPNNIYIIKKINEYGDIKLKNKNRWYVKQCFVLLVEKPKKLKQYGIVDFCKKHYETV